MTARSAQPRPVDVSEEVAQLIAAEPDGEAGADRLLRQYAGAGFTEVALDSSGRRLLLRAPRYRLKIDLDASTPAPVSAGLELAIEWARTIDLYTRLRWAAYDMHGVATAARALAPYAPDESRGLPDENPFVDVSRAAVVGIVALYVRPFTGRAQLHQKWWPSGEDELGLHRGLLEARDHIYAHADHTAYRAIFDPPSEDGTATGEPPALIERAITGDVLLKIAELSMKQGERFYAEAAKLYPMFSGSLVPSGSLSEAFDEVDRSS